MGAMAAPHLGAATGPAMEAACMGGRMAATTATDQA